MAKRALLLDACLAITFGQEERLDLLTGLPSRRVVIGERARREVERPPASTQLEAAIGKQMVEVEAIDLDDREEQHALARYEAMPAFRNRGDAEVIALAQVRGYIVGSDDRAIRRQVKNDLGPNRIAGTLDVLVWGVRDRRLASKDAEEFLRNCDVGPSILRALEAQGTHLEELLRR